jgi:hypothetical protein
LALQRFPVPNYNGRSQAPETLRIVSPESATAMSLVTGLLRLIPGFRLIAVGRPLAGAAWFAAFALALNFGILAPWAWPGVAARVSRVVLCVAAVVVAILSHRRAAAEERRVRRLAARPPTGAGIAS